MRVAGACLLPNLRIWEPLDRRGRNPTSPDGQETNAMATAPAGSVERTLPMTVSNTGFMLDRLGQDCSPLQFLRELTQNAIEAILATRERQGEIVWDVD